MFSVAKCTEWRMSNTTVSAFLIILFVLPLSSRALPLLRETLTNTTIQLPQGTRYITQEHLLCTPSTWKSIVPFFLGNYFAHVATVKFIPGESTLSRLLTMYFALVFPSSGMRRGVEAILQCASRGASPLEKACRAGALCVVVRSKSWKPQGDESVLSDVSTQPQLQILPQGEATAQSPDAKDENTSGTVLENCQNLAQSDVSTRSAGVKPELAHTLPQLDKVTTGHSGLSTGSKTSSDPNGRLVPATRWHSLRDRNFHGKCILPDGYALTLLSYDSEVFQKLEKSSNPLRNKLKAGVVIDDISMSRSVTKAVIAVIQTLYASFTLYDARGDQVELYGYAAFGLTVTPYLVMSLINLASNIATPDFPCVYLVRTPTMKEAEDRAGTVFERVVADIKLAAPIAPSGNTTSVSNSAPINASSTASDTWLSVNHRAQDRRDRVDAIAMIAAWVLSTIPIAVIAGITHFKPGHSTVAERCWIMIWLAFGAFFGVVSGKYYTRDYFHFEQNYNDDRIDGSFLVMFMYTAPAIGGLVVVGQMLSAYGNCVTLY